jgi:hypothetical protein
MKKLLLSLSLISATVPALSQPHHGHWQRHHGSGWNWVVPAIVGGAVVYSITRPEPVIVQQPVIIQPPMQIPQVQNCTPWTETHHADGTITRTRTCSQ